jgi:hypothetical protein
VSSLHVAHPRLGRAGALPYIRGLRFILRREDKALTEDSRLARVLRPFAAGYLLLGVAHIALLPPWEGFDESAHYSYIQQLADTAAVPAMSSARISADVERYREAAPLPYGTQPPFERNGGLTYRAFFGGPPAKTVQGRAFVHEPPRERRRYVPGPIANWEAQHPPLYYAALAPAYRATRGWSWAAHLFSLRLASYLLAWAAWMLALHVCQTAMRAPAPSASALPWTWAALGIAVWPLLLPAWFPEFARLGNDSLSALIATAVWWLNVRATRTGLTTRQAVALGALLGAGALTKALFVPLAAGIAGFWVVRAWRMGATGTGRAVAARLLLALVVMAAIAGWWYGPNRGPYLFPLWPEEVAGLREAGGLRGALQNRFTLSAWVRGHAALVTTVAWAGTWSLARPPYAWLAPLALTVVLLAVGYLWSVRRWRTYELAWLPAWMAAPLVAALSYHVVLRIALSGVGLTPGYYLHVLVAPLGCAAGLALRAAAGRAVTRTAALALGCYAAAFGLAVSWAQVLMFSGHVFKEGSDKFYRVGSPWPALLNVPEVLVRLRPLAYPALGAAAFVAGALLVSAGAVAAWRMVGEESAGAQRT